jgi:hypothetical protein
VSYAADRGPAHLTPRAAPPDERVRVFHSPWDATKGGEATIPASNLSSDRFPQRHIRVVDRRATA